MITTDVTCGRCGRLADAGHVSRGKYSGVPYCPACARAVAHSQTLVPPRRPPSDRDVAEADVARMLDRAVQRDRVVRELSARTCLHESGHAVAMVALDWGTPSISTRAWRRGEGATRPAPGQTASTEEELVVALAGAYAERLAYPDAVGDADDARRVAELLERYPAAERGWREQQARNRAELIVRDNRDDVVALALAIEERDDLSAAEVRGALGLVDEQPVAEVRAAAAVPADSVRVELTDADGRVVGHRFVERRNAAGAYRTQDFAWHNLTREAA